MSARTRLPQRKAITRVGLHFANWTEGPKCAEMSYIRPESPFDPKWLECYIFHISLKFIALMQFLKFINVMNSIKFIQLINLLNSINFSKLIDWSYSIN